MTIASRPFFKFCAPGGDVGARQRLALRVAAHVQRQSATTADTRRNHDLATVTLQKADRRRIDIAIERLLRAAWQQRHAHFSLTFCRIDCREENFSSRRPAGGKLDQIAQPLRQDGRERPRQPRKPQRKAKALRDMAAVRRSCAEAAARQADGDNCLRCRRARCRSDGHSRPSPRTWSCRTGTTDSDRDGGPSSLPARRLFPASRE